MNQEKMGNFIMLLRKQNSLSQKELAEKVGVSRQTISNWELGKVEPDTDSLKKLSKIFGVSLEEILNGEIKIDKKVKSNKWKLSILISIIIISIILFIFILYNICNNHLYDYEINVETEEINISNGIIVLNSNEVYFYLGELSLENKKDISSIDLFYKEENNEINIYSCSNCNASNIALQDNINTNTYFDMKNIKNIIKNMYIRITLEDNNYFIIKLELDKFNHKISGNIIENDILENDISIISNKEIMNIVTKCFKVQDDGYIYENEDKGKKTTIIYVDNNITIDIIDGNIEENYDYNLLSGYLFYEKIINKNTIDNQIINTKDNLEDNTIINSFNDIMKNI
jgi:transcriptional regulator with XRE-family HTH domain